ncbi:MAG: hypothetical protein WCS94_24200 [Verrucomicrobiota bacterium]
MKIFGGRFHQPFMADEIESRAFDGPLPAHTATFLFHGTEFLNHKTPGAVYEFWINAHQIGFGHGDVDGRLRGRVVLGPNNFASLSSVAGMQAFAFAGGGIETKENFFPFAEPVFVFHGHLSG